MMQQDQWWAQDPVVRPVQATPRQQPQNQGGASDQWWAQDPVVQQQAPRQTPRQAPAQAPDPLASYAETLRAEGIPESEIPDLSQAMMDEASGIFPVAPPVQAQSSLGTRDNPIDLRALTDQTVPMLRRGAFVRNGDEVYALPADAYIDHNVRPTDEPLSGNAFMRRPNLQDQVGAFASAFTEQIPFGDEAVAGAVGLLSGEGYDAVRRNQIAAREVLNQTEGGLRDIGGIAGLGASLFAPGSAYIQGAQGINRIGRAAQVGAGYGALFGAGNTDGDLQERLAASAINAGIGAGGGALFQRGADRLADAAANARANPSPQRQLAAAGVDLTPGQMMGGFAQRMEDASSSIPILGDAIREARIRGLETFNEAAINQALQPLGRNVSGAGRDAMGRAEQAVSDAYGAALQGVAVPRDQAFDVALTGIVRQNPLPGPMQSNFEALVNNTLQRLGQGVDGETFKQIDSELAAAVRSAEAGAQREPVQRLLANKLQQAREAFQGLLTRADPMRAADVGQANLSSAMMMRLRDAAQSLGTSARGGLFTPGDLNRAVRAGDSSAGNRQFARGEALMQGLSDAAAQVLPSTVPDSGSPLRLLTAGGLGGGAATIGADPVMVAGVGAGLLGGSMAYSRFVQNAVNRAYRASTPGAARQALADVEALAAQTPALQPVYESLQSTLRPLLLGERSTTQNRP